MSPSDPDQHAARILERILDGHEELDGLAAVDAPVTAFSFTQPNRPAVLTGVRESEPAAGDDYRYLLMPVRLTG